MISEKSLHTLEYDKILDRLAGHTSFSAGRERALALRPTVDVSEARKRLARTTEARDLLNERPNTTIGGAHDVREAARRAEIGSVLRAEELLDVASTLSASDRFRSSVAKTELELEWLRQRVLALIPCPEIVTRIEETFDDHGDVMDSASARLRSIRLEIRTAHGRLMDKLNNMLTSADYRTLLQEPIVTMRNGRYVVPVKNDAKGRVKGIVHDQSASGQTVFIEPLAVTELNNRWRELQIEEQREIERILEELSGLVGHRARVIIDIVDALADIDLVLACARFASELTASPPIVNDAGRISLIEARHPLLTGKVVPINVSLGEGPAQEHGPYVSVLVITGPNTGGKTVALKTVGLLTLMAQAGMHIPAAAESTLAVFEEVWADIGDEQSIEQSLSTFSSHLRNIVEILAHTGPRSLVLLDELGAGTDPAEGSALARAIIRQLLDKGARAIATTHYSELKAFAHDQEGVENASVEFNVQTLSPTYKLVIGLPGRSQALSIAKRLGLPGDIIERARTYIPQGGQRVERLLGQIQQERRAIGNLYRRARELNEDLTKLRDRLQQEVENTREDRQRIVQEARAEANEAVRDLRKRLLDLEAESRHRPATGVPRPTVGAPSDLKRRIDAAREEALEALGGPATAGDDLTIPADGAIAVGDDVHVLSLDQKGTVVAVDGNQYQVQLGNFKLRLPGDDLRKLNRAGRKRDAERNVTMNVARQPTLTEVDVRGWRPHELEPYLERYINDSYMGGMDTLRIVHGLGTGALRKAVREQLDAHPLVASVTAADREHGGDGVTVATLAK